MTRNESAKQPRLAIVVSRFNEEITSGLLRGAKAYLAEQNIEIGADDIVEASGAFELPLIAQTLARRQDYDGIICLGCVIKGDTAHFEFISLGASVGIMMAALSTEKPITFGILTTYTDEQAEARSRDDGSNKGREAASACLETIRAIRAIRRA
jgi:6,7-dimethyl-8-ribityllumazine synthase